MDFTFLALSSDFEYMLQFRYFLLAAGMLSCIYLTVSLIHFRDKLVTNSKYKFLLYILLVAIIDLTFIFLCLSRLAFDEMFAMFILAPIVYLFTTMIKELV